MLIWQWALIASSVLFFLIFVFVLLRYLSLKKAVVAPDVASGKVNNDVRGARDGSVSPEEKQEWLALLMQQKEICTRLLGKLPDSDFQGRASLSCWSIFLDVEIYIIEQSVPDEKVIGLLEAFKKILDKIDRAQEVDALFKSLKVNQSLLGELNKVIQKAEEKVSSQVNITTELTDRLDKLHELLAQEAELDKSLAALRAEMASMCELAERLKLHLEEVKIEGEDSAYVDALEGFLGEANESVFLHSMRSELDDKVEDLKQLAAHQKSIIADLKEQVRRVKGSHDEKHIGVYDVSIARLEKSLLESGRVVKGLEGKLESLHTIKYNLNIDVVKRDEALKRKKALLDGQSEALPQGMDIYDVFDEERSAMKNMEDLLHQESFTEESDAFANEQASKIGSLRLMVNESELYVEMLERDLDKAHILRESLEHKLLHPDEPLALLGDSAESLDMEQNRDLEEIENLKEVNEELESERKRLEAELRDNGAQSDEFIKLQEKVDKLDDKIASVKEKYVEMEERYLTALMAKEDE